MVAVTVLTIAGLSVPAAGAAGDVPDPDERQHRLDELDESLRPYAEDLLEVHEEAVDAALSALDEAESELAAATEAAEQAAATAADTRAAAVRATRARDAAQRVEQRTRDEVAALTERIDRVIAELGFVAGAAYRSGGSVAGWSMSGDGSGPGLADDRAALQEAQDRLVDLRTARRVLSVWAAAAGSAATEAEEAANAAQQRLDEALTAHAEAQHAVASAREDEHQRYDEFLAESAALEEWLNEYGLTETLEGTGTFVRPATGPVTSSYGPRLHPILGYVRMHTGIDIGIGDGFIYAADHGVVVEATWNDAYGYMVIVDHGVIDGQHVSTLYAHQPGLSVDVGMPVAKGDPIGSIGSTGLSTGPHLHFEVRVGGAPVNPWPWIGNAPMPA
ncbi:MAG TPA: M23 family metallopeptidase [Jiangellaceae bacterium]|nr:M23 family metallopeptidase [Jiangellaceae bacterium]